jgi:Uma2 family endonuclease
MSAAHPLERDRRRFSVEDVLRMVEAGILGDDDRTELIDGEILTMVPQGPEHGSLKDELHARLADAYRSSDVHVLDQRPLRCGDWALPEPDLAIIRGRARDYLTRHPSAADAVLVIEIAKTSQERDREKAADYARGGAPVYWLLDLAARRLDVHAEPEPGLGRFKRLVSLDEHEDVVLPEIGARWPVATLLP